MFACDASRASEENAKHLALQRPLERRRFQDKKNAPLNVLITSNILQVLSSAGH